LFLPLKTKSFHWLNQFFTHYFFSSLKITSCCKIEIFTGKKTASTNENFLSSKKKKMIFAGKKNKFYQ
jgi:hypothetical protein